MEYRDALSFDDILLVPRYSDLNSRSEADVSTKCFTVKSDRMEYAFNFANPIGMSPMDTVSSKEMIKLFADKGMLASVHRYFKTVEEQFEYIRSIGPEYISKIFFAVGSVKKYNLWIDYLYANGVRNFIVDMAHGDSKLCIDTVSYLRSIGGDTVNIIAGNVVTKAGFNRLQDVGANGIRVGVGSGSICSTRINCGVGFPQFSAVLDCAKVKRPNVMLIACGGVKNSGDMVKAMVAGADMCFCGKLLAGTDLALGRSFDKNMELCVNESDVVYKEYRGMASREARAGIMDYSSVEGVSGKIFYTGKTEQFIKDTELNLKAALSYCGSRNWVELRRNVKIIKISNSAIIESQTHVIR